MIRFELFCFIFKFFLSSYKIILIGILTMLYFFLNTRDLYSRNQIDHLFIIAEYNEGQMDEHGIRR